MTEPSAPRGRSRTALVLPFLAAFAVRLTAGIALSEGGRGSRGFDFYGFMADNLLSGRGLCWWFYEGLGLKFANRGPLYPLFVAAARAAGGGARAVEITAQAAIGAAAICIPALLARRWSGTRAVLPALWIAALWPYSVLSDTGLIEHVLYAPLCCLTAWAILDAQSGARRPERTALAAGAIAGLATLARLTFAASLPFLGVAAVRRLGVARTALVVVGVAVVLAPWVVRNRLTVGHWVLGTDGGRALLVGNSPVTFEKYPDESIDEGEREIFRRMPPALAAELRGLAGDEVAQDARFSEIARATILADPVASAWRMLRKAATLWSPVYSPAPVSSRTSNALRYLVYAATFVPLLAAAAAAVAVCARMRSDLPLLLALILSFTVVAAVFWGQPRYLAPLHGIGIAAAAAWLSRRPESAA